MVVRYVAPTLTHFGVLMGRPAALVVFAGYVMAWVVLDYRSFDWHGGATLATWLMTLFIQRAEHRDTQAIHAKLDELLRSNTRASDRLAHIDRKEPEEIERERNA